jgi:large subunit ribosomal protein L11
MAKKIDKQFKMMAPGGQATPAPPLGPALGAAGVNPGQFIQQFNDRTRDLNGKVVGCVVTVYNDRSFEFEIKSSPAAVLIREAAGMEKGSGEPHTNKVGTITKDQVREDRRGEDEGSQRGQRRVGDAHDRRHRPLHGRHCGGGLTDGEDSANAPSQPRTRRPVRRPPGSRSAIKALKSFKGPKFDQSVEVCVHLGIDPRQADQQLARLDLHAQGHRATARVVCFCGDDKVAAAKEAGAIEAGGEDLVEKISGGWMEFDVAVASARHDAGVSKLGRVLGPKGLMPSPEGGHGDAGRGHGGEGVRRGQVGVPQRRRREHPLRDREDELLRGRSAGEPRALRGDDREDPAVGRQGPVHQANGRQRHDDPGDPVEV